MSQPSAEPVESVEGPRLVPEALACGACRTVLCVPEDVIPTVAPGLKRDAVYAYELDDVCGHDKVWAYSATNPHERRFDVIRLRPEVAIRQSIDLGSIWPTADHSWFPPCVWDMASCGACGAHLGWGFYDAATLPPKDWKKRQQQQQQQKSAAENEKSVDDEGAVGGAVAADGDEVLLAQRGSPTGAADAADDAETSGVDERSAGGGDDDGDDEDEDEEEELSTSNSSDTDRSDGEEEAAAAASNSSNRRAAAVAARFQERSLPVAPEFIGLILTNCVAEVAEEGGPQIELASRETIRRRAAGNRQFQFYRRRIMKRLRRARDQMSAIRLAGMLSLLDTAPRFRSLQVLRSILHEARALLDAEQQHNSSDEDAAPNPDAAGRGDDEDDEASDEAEDVGGAGGEAAA